VDEAIREMAGDIPARVLALSKAKNTLEISGISWTCYQLLRKNVTSIFQIQA